MSKQTSVLIFFTAVRLFRGLATDTRTGLSGLPYEG